MDLHTSIKLEMEETLQDRHTDCVSAELEAIKQEYGDNYIDTTVKVEIEQRALASLQDNTSLVPCDSQESADVKLECKDSTFCWTEQYLINDTLATICDESKVKTEPRDAMNEVGSVKLQWMKQENEDADKSDFNMFEEDENTEEKQYKYNVEDRSNSPVITADFVACFSADSTGIVHREMSSENNFLTSPGTDYPAETPQIMHQSSHHVNSVTCKFCFKTFLSGISMYDHIFSLHKDEKYTCVEHGKKFSDKRSLKRHIAIVHKQLIKVKHTCSECEAQFTDKTGLNTHIDRVHKYIKHACNECELQFTDRRILNSHKFFIHKNINYDCSLCKAQFTKKNYLTNHMVSVHNAVLPKHDCHECEAHFTVRSALKRHMESVHKHVKCTLCQICGVKMKKKSHLKKHIDSVHYKIKPHSCPHCSYASAHSSNLQAHIDRIHNKHTTQLDL